MSTRRTDVVTINFTDDRILGVCVIGSARPCERFLEVGQRVIPAIICLLENGFRVITERNDILVFRRMQ